MTDSLILATMIAVNGGVPGCARSDPTITAVAVQNVASNAGVNQYTVRVTVANRGQSSQGGNVMQSVEMYQDATKVGERGIPPLKAGSTYVFPYRFTRNSDAADGTTRLVFQRDKPVGMQSCMSPDDRYALSV